VQHYPQDSSIFVVPDQFSPRKLLSPNLTSSGVLLASLVFAYLISENPSYTEPSTVAQQASIYVGLGLLGSIAIDLRRGWRNIFRMDLLCLVSLYGLTLLEFLFSQPNFDQGSTTVASTVTAIHAVLLGMAGLVVGRHLSKRKPIRLPWLNFRQLKNKQLFTLLVLAAFLGFLWMLLAVNFNLFDLIKAMMRARFSQPWARGRLGGITALLSELELFLLIVPALFGIILTRQKTFPKGWLFISTLVFSLTLFQGFCSGTRSIFVMYVASFMAGYLLNLQRNTFTNTAVPIGAAVVLLYFGTYNMLQFRTIGLTAYLAGYREGFLSDTFFVDYNLKSLGQVIAAMPEQHGFLGWEVFYWALVRPIPRILFPFKPEGLSVSIEQIVGAEGWTVATTYIGESYMAGGWIMIFLVSLGIGIFTAWWNRISVQTHSAYSMLLYASGFAAAAITMRSLFAFTTAMLPVLALILYPRFIDRSLRG
jgi:oligosaccharide repeat unit polymerase